MSGAVDNSSAVTLLSAQQIETLQQQIRQFKNLGKKFSESKIPKMIEILQNPNPVVPNRPVSKDMTKDSAKEAGSTAATGPSGSSAPTQPALSWQCFNSLLFCGPNKFPQDGAISFSSSVRTNTSAPLSPPADHQRYTTFSTSSHRTSAVL